MPNRGSDLSSCIVRSFCDLLDVTVSSMPTPKILLNA